MAFDKKLFERKRKENDRIAVLEDRLQRVCRKRSRTEEKNEYLQRRVTFLENKLAALGQPCSKTSPF